LSSCINRTQPNTKQVTQQIATDLQKAADKAQTEGNTTAANQLNRLAKDFTDASKSGDLPNLKDLAQAVKGHHRHHHSHTMFAVQANGADNDSVSAMSLIAKALSDIR